MAIGGDEDVPGIVAIEVKFDITGHIVLAKLGRSLDVEPRILTGRTVFRQVALHRVAEGNGAKAGRRHVAGVSGTEDVFKVHKPAGRKFRSADAERER